ncbi:unnamed protein product [Adineta steineri]|uniref:Uncharacterized protein n=1 Tax=Adineta steineri TaxID=433720 RepID=A0A814I8S7_9BILA|nr:unnamed protein product [Adineta steineri]CAF3990651.1 unnamed protein product [Adineta steineri]
MLLFNPNTAIRVIVISVSVGVLVSVVAASIAIAILGTKYFLSSQLIVRAEIYVALDRLVASYELDELYSRRQTLHDIIDGLNKQFSQAFPETFFKLVITAFSGKPILITDLKRKKRQYDQPSIVTVNGTVYFVANYTGNDILNALKNYSQMITLVTVDGQPSTKLATFSILYSRCTDTYPDSRPEGVVSKLLSIDATDPTTTTATSTSTLSTLTNTTATSTTNTTSKPTTNTTTIPTINITTILTTNTATTSTINTTTIITTNTTIPPTTNTTTTSTINSTTIPTINTTAIPAINITISPTTNTATIPTINTTTIPTTNIIPSSPITNIIPTSSTINTTTIPTINTTTISTTNVIPTSPTTNIIPTTPTTNIIPTSSTINTTTISTTNVIPSSPITNIIPTSSTINTTTIPTINTTTISTTNVIPTTPITNIIPTSSTTITATIPTINNTIIPTTNIIPSAPTTNIIPTSPTTNVIPTSPSTNVIPTIPTTNIIPTSPTTNIIPTSPSTNVIPTIPTTNIIPTSPTTNIIPTSPTTNIIPTIPTTNIIPTTSTINTTTTATIPSTTIIAETTTNTTSTCKPIFAINMTVALERSIYPNELPQFYDRYNLRLDLFDAIHDQIEEYFSNQSITFTMIDMSDEPVLLADSMLEGTDEVGTDEYAYDALPTKKLTTKKSIVIIHGELLSKEYITNQDIINAFQDFSVLITLITPDGESSRYSSSFDNEYSSFQNMSRVEFTDGNTNFSICYNSSCGTFTFHSTPIVRNTTTSSNSATQSAFKADFHLYLVSNTTGYSSSLFYNTSRTLGIILNQFLLYFPETLLTVVISNITDNSSLNNVNSRKKREADEALLSIAVDASVYFLLDHTKEEIINVFQDYSLLIYATTDSGEPIVAAGNVSMDYSTFTNTYLTQIPHLENTILNCIYLA